jgi:hypothetical protein
MAAPMLSNVLVGQDRRRAAAVLYVTTFNLRQNRKDENRWSEKSRWKW